MNKLALTGLLVVLLASAARAEVKTKIITYKHDGETLKGFLAYDDAQEGKRPGVLVAHEWWGLNDYARDRAKQLAKLGYVAFAADMYGAGKTTKHPATAKEWATASRKDPEKWRARAKLGLKILMDQSQVDSERLAAIGYCFGGSTVLQLAFSGAPLKAVVSFHGALSVPTEEEAKNIKGTLLIAHGAEDSFIPDEVAQKMRHAFDQNDVDYMMTYYGNARHSFTVPNINEVGIEGLRYNPDADRRSWQHMQLLFAEKFGK